MKLTKNRKLILGVLDSYIADAWGAPPHSADTVRFELDRMGIRYHKNAIYRTLKDLLDAGLIVAEKRLTDPISDGLPYWQNYYQLTGSQDANAILLETETIHKKLDKAVHGVNFFGAIIDLGLPPEEVVVLKARVKSLMQHVHPDKSNRYEYEAKLLGECMKWIKEGIPIPGEALKNKQLHKVS